MNHSIYEDVLKIFESRSSKKTMSMKFHNLTLVEEENEIPFIRV